MTKPDLQKYRDRLETESSRPVSSFDESIHNSGLKIYEYISIGWLYRHGQRSSLPIHLNSSTAMCDKFSIICQRLGYPERSPIETAKRVLELIKVPEIMNIKPYIGTYTDNESWKGTPSPFYGREIELAEYMLTQGTKKIQIGNVGGSETRFAHIVVRGGSPTKFINDSLAFYDKQYGI